MFLLTKIWTLWGFLMCKCFVIAPGHELTQSTCKPSLVAKTSQKWRFSITHLENKHFLVSSSSLPTGMFRHLFLFTSETIWGPNRGHMCSTLLLISTCYGCFSEWRIWVYYEGCPNALLCHLRLLRYIWIHSRIQHVLPANLVNVAGHAITRRWSFVGQVQSIATDGLFKCSILLLNFKTSHCFAWKCRISYFSAMLYFEFVLQMCDTYFG